MLDGTDWVDCWALEACCWLTSWLRAWTCWGQSLKGQVLLGAFGLQGYEGLVKGCDATGIILGIAGTVISSVMHRGAVALVFFVFLDPETLELVPLDESGVGMILVPFFEFILELASVLDGREGGFKKQVRVERATCFGRKHLLSLDVEEERLNWLRRVPLLVQIHGEILDVIWGYSPVSIVEIYEDVADGFVAESTLADGE